MSERRPNGPQSADERIEVVLFDLGGVLMDFGGLARLAALAGRPDDEVLRAVWAGSPWVQAFERGACDADSFARHVVAEWGIDLSPTAFIDEFRQWSAGPFPGAIDLVRRLSDVVAVGCLSNTNPVHWQQHLDRWGLVEHFDWRFASHELGLLKPDPAVYEHVVRIMGTVPERVLFLDDSDENVDAARITGMRAERVRGLDEVRTALRARLATDADRLPRTRSTDS